MKADFERETKEARKEFQNLEKRIVQKEENLDKKQKPLISGKLLSVSATSR